MLFLVSTEITVWLALVIGAIAWRNLNTGIRLIYLQITVAAVVDTWAFYIATHKGSSIPLYNSYIFLETWILGLAAIYIVPQRKVRYTISAGLGCFSIIWAYFFYKQWNTVFCNWAYLIECILVAGIYMYILINEYLSSPNKSLHNPLAYLCTGILLYFILNIPYFGLMNYVIKHNVKLADELFSWINIILLTIRYLFISISFVLFIKLNKKNTVVYEQ